MRKTLADLSFVRSPAERREQADAFLRSEMKKWAEVVAPPASRRSDALNEDLRRPFALGNQARLSAAQRSGAGASRRQVWNSEPRYHTEEEMADYFRAQGVKVDPRFRLHEVSAARRGARASRLRASRCRRRHSDVIFGLVAANPPEEWRRRCRRARALHEGEPAASSATGRRARGSAIRATTRSTRRTTTSARRRNGRCWCWSATTAPAPAIPAAAA